MIFTEFQKQMKNHKLNFFPCLYGLVTLFSKYIWWVIVYVYACVFLNIYISMYSIESKLRYF